MVKNFRVKAFSLVELIVVITILGIITAFIVPRYINVKDDATRGVITRISGSLSTVATLVRSKAAAQDIQNGMLTVNGVDIEIIDSYPEAHWNDAFRYLLNITADSGATGVNSRCIGFRLCGVGNQGWLPLIGNVASGRVVMIWPEGYRLNEGCYAYYHLPENGNPPVISSLTTGC